MNLKEYKVQVIKILNELKTMARSSHVAGPAETGVQALPHPGCHGVLFCDWLSQGGAKTFT